MIRGPPVAVKTRHPEVCRRVVPALTLIDRNPNLAETTTGSDLSGLPTLQEGAIKILRQISE
jgi:hypothetical protein